MMETLKKLWQNPMVILKGAGIAIVVLVVLTLSFQFIGSTVRSLGLGERFGIDMVPSFGGDTAMYNEDSDAEFLMQKGSVGRPATTTMPPINEEFSGGNTAEDFEITEYNATIKTHDKDEACAEVGNLKSREYIIFENTNDYETGCSFSFKVEHAHAQEILTMIEAMDPDTLSANTYTIKRTVDDTTNELKILQQKLQSINETLESSLAAYDEISQIATSTRDAESLATIIDSKIRLIERLTQERINVSDQIQRMQRAMNDQLERLDYTYFYISVQEDKFVDGKRLQDSWKDAIQSFVHDTNAIFQGITIGMITFLLFVAQYVLYFFILLFIVKYGWKYAKQIWKQ